MAANNIIYPKSICRTVFLIGLMQQQANVVMSVYTPSTFKKPVFFVRNYTVPGNEEFNLEELLFHLIESKHIPTEMGRYSDKSNEVRKLKLVSRMNTQALYDFLNEHGYQITFNYVQCKNGTEPKRILESCIVNDRILHDDDIVRIGQQILDYITVQALYEGEVTIPMNSLPQYLFI